MNISFALQDYLEAILILKLKNEELKSSNLSKFLKVSKPAVTKALNELANLKLVIKNNYQNVEFTKLGEEEAKKIYDKHETIKKFLINLGISKKTASIDCCKIEHVISDETIKAFKKYNNKIKK